MKKVLVYSHDTFGLGNIRRMLSVAKNLLDGDQDLSILILSGSPMLHAFRIPPGIDYVKLPCLSRDLRGRYGVKYLGLDYDAAMRMRANLITSTVLDFAPDLILVDKKPLGVGNELQPTLDLLQRRSGRPRMVLLLRDILDAPQTTREIWRRNGYFDTIEAIYDRVLVVGSPEVFDLAEEYGFPPSCRDKLVYCGYLGRDRGRRDRQSLRRDLGVGARRMVLVTAGGGEDGYRLLSCYLHAINTQGPNLPVRSVVLCGSEMSEAQRRNLREAAAANPHILVLDFTDDMMSYLDAADVVVAMGGYNTLCEILTLKKRAVVVPRVRPVQEQWIRAERMAQLGLVQALHPDRLSARNLIQALRRELTRANVRPAGLYQLDLEGHARIRTEIAALVSGPRPRFQGYPSLEVAR